MTTRPTCEVCGRPKPDEVEARAYVVKPGHCGAELMSDRAHGEGMLSGCIPPGGWRAAFLAERENGRLSREHADRLRLQLDSERGMRTVLAGKFAERTREARELREALADMVSQHGGEETCLSANEDAVDVLERTKHLAEEQDE